MHAHQERRLQIEPSPPRSPGVPPPRARPLRPQSLARCRPRSGQMRPNRCRPGRAAAASGLMPGGGGMQQY
eukprot:15467986-Alexandrium_andersonii.AAC.1